MADYEEYYDPAWPPGTVKLAQLLVQNAKHGDIILQPRPTSDPNDPLTWPGWQKALNYGLAAFYAMMVFAFVNATSPTWGPLADELGFDDATLTNTYAIGCATLALGAPMLIPFALKFGSRVVYIVSSVGQFAISIWAAKTMTAGDWWGVNALQCWLGALAEVLIQMTIADIFFVHQRGKMNAGYVWFANVGQTLAIVAAGFVTQDLGWRWVWWLFTIFFGVQFIMFVFGFVETKYVHAETLDERQGRIVDVAAPSSRQQSEKDSEKKTGPESPTDVETGELQETARRLSTINVDSSIPKKSYWKRLDLLTVSPGKWEHFLRHSWQPFMILFTIPGVTFGALVYAIVLAFQTVQTAILSTVMIDEPYNFTASQIGLMNLGPFVGATLGSLICGPLSDWVALRLARANDGIYEPEMRFWVFVPFIPFQVAGAWWFGYALNNRWDWSQVVVAWGMCWFGSAPLQSIALTYIIDAYNEIIGDALTAVTVVRNTFATIFVFAIPAWISAVGIANIFNTIGAIGLFILSFGFVFIWKGKHFRIKTVRVYRYYADRQYDARPM